MIEIRNLQFQPLTLNLSGQGTLHLGPRERKSIARKDLSAEIKTAGKRGLVRITDLTGGVDRINVRRLMMYMEEAISESSRFVVFEPNHPQTWRALGRLINPFLQDIKDKGGLYDFAFQCDEETNTPAVIDRNEMVARVFVKPTKTAEFIELNFILTSTGADFKEII